MMRDDPDPGHSMIDAAVCDEPVASRHAIDLLLPDNQHDDQDRLWPAERLRRAALTALDTAHEGAGSVTVVLSDDEEVRALNRQFRGADKPTNVLSFPGADMLPAADQPAFLGDVILARETVLREASAQDKTFEDHATHLVVHGVLHLLGHTHDGDEDATRMEALEVAILSELGVADPYDVARHSET